MPCSVDINGQTLERVPSTKFLGVEIDETLEWKTHINSVASKVAKSASVMYKAKDFFNLLE